MSKVAIQGNASGTGTLTVAAPNTNSDYTLTLPAETGTVLTSGGAIDVNASAPADSLAIGSTGTVTQNIPSASDYTIYKTNGSTKGVLGDESGNFIVKSASALLLQTNGSERMRIDSSGNVGIGTSSPNTVSARTVLTVASAGAGGGEIDLTVGGTTALRVLTDGSYNTEFRNPQNSPLIFSTNNTERMRIDSSGALWVGSTGSTQPYNATSGTYVKLGDSAATFPITATSASLVAILNRNTSTGVILEFKYNGTAYGSVSTNGSSVTYNTSSDYRLKENIAPMTGALSTVAQLKPVTYTWKNTGIADTGFIAHELAEVMPTAVTGEKDAVDDEGNPVYQGIDTSFLVATLTAAIQELSAKNDALEARIAALEAA